MRLKVHQKCPNLGVVKVFYPSPEDIWQLVVPIGTPN